MPRYKNYGLWASLFALVGILVRIKYPQYLGDWTDFASVLLTGLVAGGVVSNPTTQNKGFLDDKK